MGEQINRYEHDIPDEWNALTNKIIGLAIEVHSTLGPGLLEKMYEDALCVEFDRAGIPYERQMPVRMSYKGVPIGNLRVDLVVSKLVILELKAIEKVIDIHGATLLSYLRSTDLPLGLILNFHVTKLTDGISRRFNPHSSLVKALPKRNRPSLNASSASSALSASSVFNESSWDLEDEV